MRNFGVILAAACLHVFVGFTIVAIQDGAWRDADQEFLSWWIVSGIGLATGVGLFLWSLRKTRPMQPPAIEMPMTYADWKRLRGRGEASPGAGNPATTRATAQPGPSAVSSPPMSTPAQAWEPTRRRRWSPMNVIALLVVGLLLAPMLMTRVLGVLTMPLVLDSGRPFPLMTLALLLLIAGVAYAHRRRPGRLVDGRAARWVAWQAVRWCIALALFASPVVFLIVFAVGSATDRESREALGLMSMLFGPVVMFLGAVVGLPLAWAFLALTREGRRRTIGEIARENEARELDRNR